MSVRVCGGHPENPLQQARLKAGVSQDQIAEHLSCDIRTIQRHEAGVQFPDWNELLKMKVRYSCEFADLFPEEFR
ncbi:MAG: helix-turn-helix transcriptional regulator [Blautia massiliensis (ex Durand et al. 2017)]